MHHVVFVAPYYLQATLRFINSVAKLSGIKLSLVSNSPLNTLPAELRQRLTGYYRVNNCLDAGQLAVAVRALSRQHGGVHRLFGALEDLQVALGQVRDHLGIEGLGAEASKNFRDKSRMKTLLRGNGLPCARHCLVTSAEEALAFVKVVGYPLVLKPPAGAGARNTFEVSSDDMLADYLAAYSPSPNNPTLFEEFIQGEEHSFEAISIRGQVVWHSLTRYYPSPLEVLKNPWIKWCILLPREIDDPKYDDIRKVNGQALSVLGMHTGLTHMEWFRRPGGSLAISEVAARPPGAQIVSLMGYAHEKNFYDAWAEVMVFDRFQAPQRKYAAGAAFLRGEGQGRVKAIRGVGQAQREVGSLVIEAKLPEIGQFSAQGYEGEGYVLVRHPQTEVVKQALKRLVTLIRIEYE